MNNYISALIKQGGNNLNNVSFSGCNPCKLVTMTMKDEKSVNTPHLRKKRKDCHENLKKIAKEIKTSISTKYPKLSDVDFTVIASYTTNERFEYRFFFFSTDGSYLTNAQLNDIMHNVDKKSIRNYTKRTIKPLPDQDYVVAPSCFKPFCVGDKYKFHHILSSGCLLRGEKANKIFKDGVLQYV